MRRPPRPPEPPPASRARRRHPAHPVVILSAAKDLLVPKPHHYATTLTWTGNTGTGTSGYRAYSRAHESAVPGKPVLAATSDPAFRGDPARWNPEELLVASLSSCHMLWFPHLASEAGIVVSAYTDAAAGTMTEEPGGEGQFREVVLRPVVTIRAGDDEARAMALHHAAHEKCFISRSVNFPVRLEPRVQRAQGASSRAGGREAAGAGGTLRRDGGRRRTWGLPDSRGSAAPRPR